jgi:2-dehydro-3-deoxygluconokinase
VVKVKVMGKILCFGELLLRYSPAVQQNIFQEQAMPVFIGGAELNVAHALACWNMPVSYCTVMPQNFLSTSIVNYLQENGIDVSPIRFTTGRLGVYYLQQGADVKSSEIVFDRANSSFANIPPKTIQWHTVLAGVDWLHISAIAVALSASATAVCMEALAVAKELGIKISIDLNYRAALWQYGVQPLEVMTQILPYCHVVMGNIWSAEKLLHIPFAEASDLFPANQNGYIDAANISIQNMLLRYPNIQYIAYTFRFTEHYFGVLYHQQKLYQSTTHYFENVVDKVGSGDCFMAGLLYGIQHKKSPQFTVEFATAAAVGKFQEKGDHTRQTVDSIKKSIHAQL